MKGIKKLKLCLLFLCLSAISFPNIYLNYFLRFFAIAFACLTIYGYRQLIGKFFKKEYFTIFFVIYLLIVFVSSILSVDKVVTVLKITELFIDFMVIRLFFLVDVKDNNLKSRNIIYEMMELVTNFSLVLIIIIWIGYFLLPSSFVTISRGIITKQLGTNILLSSNACGSLAVGIIIWYLINGNTKQKIVIPFMLLTVLFSMSRTAIIILAIVLILYLLIMKFNMFSLFVLIILVFSFISYQDSIMQYFMRGQSVNTFSTLSGRVVMWNNVLDLFKASPLIGYGFGVGSQLIKLDGIVMESVHNGFFEVLIDSGILGLTMMILYIATSVVVLFKKIKICGLRASNYSVLIRIYLIIRTFLSLGMGGWHTLDMILFLLVTYYDMTTIFKEKKMNEV